MHELLSRFYDLAREEVQRYGGRVSKFLGDGFMAVMGAPAAHEDHALRAVLTALGLRRRLAEGPLAGARPPDRPGPDGAGQRNGRDREHRRRPGCRARRDRRDGQHGRAAPGPGRARTIVASEATARLVAGAIRLEPLGPLEWRGGSVPVGAHLVLGVGPERSPQRGLDPRTLGPFVGRERPLAALGEAVAEAREGRGQVVGVVGEPGMAVAPGHRAAAAP